MTFGLKKLVRAISPLIRTTSTNKPTAQEEENHEVDYSKFEWDLSQVDIKTALKLFYRQYNPEKSFIVGEILQKYEGDESILLQQLCERYNLTEEDMQLFLDQAPAKHNSFEEKMKQEKTRRQSATGTSVFNRRPSFSSTNSDSPKGKEKEKEKPVKGNLSRTNSENTFDDAPKSKEKEKRRSYIKVETDSIPESDYTNNTNSKGTAQKIQNYYWDLNGIDVGQALKLLYKDLNPTKSPNVSALEHKSNKEILNVLRQLCKRHCLTESEMAAYLNKSRKQSSQDEDDDLLDFDMDNTVEKPRRLNEEKNNQPGYYQDRSELADHMKHISLTQRNPYSGPIDSSPPPPPPPAARPVTTTSVPAPAPPPPMSRPNNNNNPAPPPPPAQSQSSAVKKNFAPFSSEQQDLVIHGDDQYEEEQDQEEKSQMTNSTNRYSVEHLKPLLPDGKRFSYGPIVRELRGEKGNSQPEQPPAPASQQATEPKEKKQLLPENPSRNNSTANRLFSISDEVSSIGGVHALSDPTTPAINLNTPQSNNNNSQPNLNSPEFELFKNELEKTKQQILEMSKENQLVLSLLKTNGNQPGANNNNVQKENKGTQADDIIGKTDNIKAKNRISMLEAKIKQMELEKEEILQEKEEIQEKLDGKDHIINNLKLDKHDLLQLINILATAPISAKSVLESYLNKLRSAAGNEPILREKVFDAKNIPMGDRINSLLDWKRKNEEKFLPQQKKTPKTPQKEEEGKNDQRDDYEQNNENEYDDEGNQGDDGNQVDEEEDNYDDYDNNNNVENEAGVKDYQNFQGKELLLNVRAGKEAENNNNNSNRNEFLAASVSPQEKKLYQGLGNKVSNNSAASSITGSRSTTPNQSSRLKNMVTNHSLRDRSPEQSITSSSASPRNPSNPVEEAAQQQLLTEQYELARKLYQSQRLQAKISEKMANSNLTLQELETNKKMKEAIDHTSRSSSPQRLPVKTNEGQDTANNTTNGASSSKPEWIECFDPKSGRKYYYNTILKKSTWKNPYPDGNIPNNSANLAASGPPSRQPSPALSQGNNSRYMSADQILAGTGGGGTMGRSGPRVTYQDDYYSEEDLYQQQQLQQQQQYQQDYEEDRRGRSRSPQRGPLIQQEYDINGYPVTNGRSTSAQSNSGRGPSPFLKNYLSTTVAASASVANYSKRSQSSNTTSSAQQQQQQQQKKPGDVWVTAIDPKTQRKYWYNRETKVSTWRKPIEL